MKILLYIILFVGMLPSVGWSDELTEVSDLTKAKIETLVALIKDKNLNKEERNTQIIAEIEPLFDFQRMAQLSLGKKYWSQMTPEQKKEFSALFIKRMQESFLEKLELYTDEKVEFLEAKKVKKRIYIMTHLITKDENLEVLYKLYKSKKKGWQVYDVEILGVSLIKTYLSQLGGLLKQNSIEDLLAKLKTSGGLTIPDNQ